MEPIRATRFFNADRLLLLAFTVLKLLISLLPFHYGINYDELYYLSMSKHLGLGYVDVPPLAPLLLAINRYLLGDSIFALHLLPAISGVIFLWLCYILIKKLGGNNFALLLTLASVTLAPFVAAIDSRYTYDTFSKLFWLLFSYLMIRLIQTENPRYWIYLGIAAGFGLLFKITLLYLALGWLIGLLLTKQRRLLRHSEVIWGGALTLLIFSPYLYWQFQHGFISLEYYHNYIGKVIQFSVPGYLLFQALAVNPATLVIWLRGLYFLLFSRQGKLYRSAGIAYLTILVLSFLLHAKPDLLLPFYVILIAAGSVRLGNLSIKFKWRKPLIVTSIIIIGILMLPAVRPVLPVKTFIRVYGIFTPLTREERFEVKQLPAGFATDFGWEEMTAEVAEVYHSLPTPERSKVCILTGDYGQAGAIEFYGKKYGLPLPPLSGHNQFHVWGPGRFSGDITITIGFRQDFLVTQFKTVQQAAIFSHPYRMPNENNLAICICRDPFQPFPKLKTWYKWLN